MIPQGITQRARAHRELVKRLARGTTDAIGIRFDGAVKCVEKRVVRQLQHFQKPIVLRRSRGGLLGFLADQRAQFLNNEICWRFVAQPSTRLGTDEIPAGVTLQRSEECSARFSGRGLKDLSGGTQPLNQRHRAEH